MTNINKIQKDYNEAIKFYNMQQPLTSTEKLEIEQIVYYSDDLNEKVLPFVKANQDNLSKIAYLNLMICQSYLGEANL